MKHLWYRVLTAAASVAALVACMDYGQSEEQAFTYSQRGLFIACEGNFTAGNASLSFYVPSERRLENNVFMRANGMKLGDVAQSVAVRGDRAYVVVNNSGVVYVIDTRTFEVCGLIEGVVSPRYIHFTNDSTAYVTDLYDPQVTVVDTRNNRIRRRIPTNGHRSTEQMAQWGDEVFINCWSYDDKILVVDAAQDKLIDSIQVGPQPSSIALDRHGKLWVVTDGRTEGIPAELCRIDAASRQIEQRFTFASGDHPSVLTLNGMRDTLYFLNRDVWRMPVTAESLPTTPFLRYTNTIYYGLTVDPVTSEVYVADAIDYVQPGVVYRFTPRATPIDTLRVGITPGAFCFKPQNP